MLKIGDKKYYINKKKGTVAAVAENSLEICDDFEPNTTSITGAILTDAICDVFGQAAFMMETAVARCSGDDVFDENTGKIIASAKHDAAAHRKAAGIYGRTIAEMKKAIALAEEMQRKHIEKASVCDDVIVKCAESQNKGKEE